MPVPDRFASVATLDGAIEIVPVIEDSVPNAWRRGNIEALERLMCLQEPQEMKRAVEHANVIPGGNDDDPTALEGERADDITLRVEAIEIEGEPCDQGQ